MEKRVRRKYSREFKEEAVNLVIEQGYSVTEAGRNLGVNPCILGRWKRELEDQGRAPDNPKALKDELKCLRKENKRLRMEREILKKAAAFFAKEAK
jgi:transposase